jgi:hypothetical protein
MAIKNGGLPSVPRTIAVSWDSYLSMLEGARVKCISLHFLQGDTVLAVVSY